MNAKEQHYIVVFDAAGYSIGTRFVQGIIIEEYPGSPNALIQLFLTAIANDSEENFGMVINHNSISILSLTKVN